MANYLSPADRRARTELMRQQRSPAYRRQKEKEEMERLEAAQNAASIPASADESADGNGFVKALHTVGDVHANVLGGALKGLEGIGDFMVSVLPYTGSTLNAFGPLGTAAGMVLGNIYKDELKEFVEKDIVGENIATPMQQALDKSVLNNNKAGQITEGIAQGVGQLLPAVAVTVLSSGTGAPAAVAELASLGTTIASAAGTGTEQAFQEGADYGKGVAYGAAVGAVEGATEKLTGGLGGLYGDGIKIGSKAAKTVGKEVADVGLKRVAKEAIGEGVEEMISEAANPALKTIYKGSDALQEYGEADFWAGVGEAGIIGAGTSVAYGGTVGKLTKTSGAYADARSVMEHMDTQQKLRSKKGLSQADLAQIEKNIKADQELLSKRLQRLSKDKRAAVLKKMPALSAAFDEDGSINAEQRAALDANIKAAEDTTYDARYRTSTLGAETIDATLKNGSTDSHEMRAFSGELNAEQQAGLDTVREMMGAVAARSGNALGGFLVTQTSPKGGAYFDPNTRVMTIGADTLNSGNVSEAVARALESDATLGTIVHEVTHGIEETNAGKALAKLLTDNTELHDLAIKDVLKRGYLQEYFGKDGAPADIDTVKKGIENLIAKENAGEMLTEVEQAALDEYRSEVAAFASQRLFGNKAFMKKLITTDPTTAEKLIGKIREMRENFKVRKDPEAKAQLELVRKAEKLFMQGLAEAGGTIDSKGKIHLANREEDELTRENSEKMHDSEENGGENAAEDASGENKKSPAEGEVRWSKGEKYDFTKPFAEQVDDFDKGIFPDRDSLVIGATPQLYQGIGFNALPMTINQTHVDYALNGTKNADHWLGKAILKQLPDALKSPLAIITSNTDPNGSVVVLLALTHGGKQIITPVYIDGFAFQHGVRIDSNAITSVHARKNAISGLLNDALQAEAQGKIGVFYWDKKRTSALLSGGGVIMPHGLNLRDGPIHSIREKGSPVKPKMQNVTESQQFKRWFGDWQSNPKKASKIVDKDGKPLVVYHGTNQGDFDVFLWEKTQRADGGFYGRGHYFTASLEMAKRYGKKVVAAYLNIRNPFVWSEQIGMLNGKKGSNLLADNLIKRINMARVFPSLFADKVMEGLVYDVKNGVESVQKVKWSELEARINEIADEMTLRKFADGSCKWFVQGRFFEESVGDSYKTEADAKADKFSAAATAFAERYQGIARNMSFDDLTTYVQRNGDEITSLLKKAGYDGAMQNAEGDEIVAFESTQIKSATDNIGTFDGKNPNIRYSRKSTGDVVTISKGELAKLHANYAGEKTFAKKDVVDALKSVEALKVLPAARRAEIANEIWKGYNQRLHQQGFEMFTELAWHELHAEVMQETSFEMSDDAIRAMDEQIAAALHQIVASGKPSIKAKLESATSTEGYRKQAEFWREEHGRATARHKKLNSLKYELENLANQKKGRYVNAANYRGDSFNVAINELAKMNWRGGLVNDSKIREHFASLAAWYTKENPLYKGGEDGNSNFRQEISDALNSLGNSQNGALTVEDLQVAETVVKYFAHEIEAHNTVYKDGKRVDAMPEAKAYIEKVQRAKEISVKCGIWGGLMRSGFARMVADPAMLMRQADGYLNGFFTEQYEQLRQGTIEGAVKEREISEEFEQFWEKNKAYGKRYNTATVTFDGVEMPLQEGIMLYMTMHRDHAFAGLAGAGFEIDGKHATENISDGFAADVEKQIAEDWKALPLEELLTLTKKKNAEIERAALAKVVEQKRQALYDQFTAEDKVLIEIMERGYEACREVKEKIDEIVQGYTNVTGGYYCPIRRAGLAENVDAYTGFEGDRVTNLSMNKDTVKNAHKLYIEPAHVVFMRHVKATALYHGLGVFTDNFNRLYNLNIGTNANNPITVRTALGQSNKFAKEMVTYFKELKQDVEGISKKRNSEKFYNDAVAFIRSSYATYQLGANPKVWVTQLSSFLASTSIIDADCLAKGVTVSGKDVDKYCRLAWLRNGDDSAAMAQAVSTPQNAVQRAGRNVLQKIRDVAMWPIGRMDRLVITRLFGACQVQIEKKGGAKVGTEQNKIEAGKLMTRVILETQQNSLATERSAAMRSGDELLKGFTMFSADAMKVGARFVDAFGELSALKTLRKEAKKAGNGAEVERLNKEIKRAKKQCVRASVSLVSVALFNALLAYGFKWLYRRDEDESVGTVVADTFGNMLGGIPLVRDLWGFFQDGFEMDHFLIGTVNDVLGTASATFELLSDAMSGKEVTKQQAMSNMRKVLYAAGQLSGVPVRNIYNVTTGLLNRVSPEVGYSTEALFTTKAYSSDLKKAMEAGDEDMVATIAGLMLDEKSVVEDSTRQTYRDLIGKGYSVLPRSVGDSITVDSEKLTLTGAQQKRFRSVYDVGQKAVADLCKLSQFKKAEDAVQAKAIQFVNDVYWELAVADLTGSALAEKNVLFAEAIPIEKLAVIIATARAIEGDKGKDGKTIAGTKKRKVQTFVNSLHLTAAQKYMVMGYLGYSNVHGAQQVKSYIGRLGLDKQEQAALLKYSGYAS